MPAAYEIRANYDADTIVMYQAYSPAIAVPAIRAQRFVPPFSFGRMTWIKPSFLWLMERSNWGQKTGQEHILAVCITRAGWDTALAQGVLTSYAPRAHRDQRDWHAQFDQALVHVQWDPERSIRGTGLSYDSIQVGLSRHVIRRFVDEWTVSIKDYTPLVRKIAGLLKDGKVTQAQKLLPLERVYPVDPAVGRRLLIVE